MKKIGFVIFLFLLSLGASAQTVILNVDADNEKRENEFGPNLNRYNQIFIRGGFLASKDFEGARIKYGKSVNLALGFRKKYKIGATYSLGFDIDLQFTDYKFKQEEGKIFPDTIINNVSERLDYYSLGLGFYQRINFDPGRGNFLGFFLDVGIMGDWHFSVKDISKNKQNDGTIIKEVTKNLPYVNELDAKIYSRIGFGKTALFGSYRMTELFKSSWTIPDMPRLIMGIEMAFN